MLTPTETTALRALLQRESAQLGTRSQAEPAEYSDLAAGDVAQIRPFADEAFGGMLVQITATTPYELRGFLLRPHRGGCREAWLRLKPCQLERIGRVYWPDPEFARRCAWNAPACQVRR
jgi:hypothetical protein